MARSLFRGTPELSRLFAEAPFALVTEFFSHRSFGEFLAGLMSTIPIESDESAKRDALTSLLKALRADRLALIEVEARRVMALSENTRDAVLRKLGENLRFRAKGGLSVQRDAVARSLWSYLNSVPLFEAAERAMQVRVFRERGGLFEAWSIDGSIVLTAESVDADGLATEIAARLQHDEGCKVEAVDLPSDLGDSREVLLAVTFFGAYASQRTVRPDKSTEIVYFRPPDELLLVYSQSRRRIEVCARDATERRLVANIFAGETLKHDLSNKPLTQKSYNLARFRSSLSLPIPEQESHRVRRASITEIEVALGDWSRRVSLKVAPEDDIDALARSIFGAIIPRSGRGFVTKVRFDIEHIGQHGRTNMLRFDVFGRNKSNIQQQPDPIKRALGYDLLEAWGVMTRVGDLPLPELREKLPQLLALYDFSEGRVSGRVLEDLGVDAGVLAGAGFLTRKGWSDVILFEDEELGDVVHDVKRDGSASLATLTLTDGGSGPQIPVEDIAQFDVNFDCLRDALRDVLKPINLKGRVREVDVHLHQLGTARIGLADAPIYLARGFSDDKLLDRADRLMRSESNLLRGIVFVPQHTRFPYMGCHVVLSLRDHVDPETGQIDVSAVSVAFEAAIDPAARGAAVHFRKQGADTAQITVPGQNPRIITGAKKVLLFERLCIAHRDREQGVKLGVLKAFAGFSQLQQLFGDEWAEVKDRYLYSPRHGVWAICETPISN